MNKQYFNGGDESVKGINGGGEAVIVEAGFEVAML